MPLSKDFQILNKLGQGAYSTVYKVLRLEDSKVYALKKVKLFNLSQKQRENALNEIRILASIQNKHIIGYKQAFFDEESKSLCTVMQFANEGDLLHKVNEKIKNSDSFQEEQIWKIFVSIVEGLKCLHSHKILHQDIKTANIFLHDGMGKLGDMNVSKISQEGLCNTQTGTPYYASPQVWKDLPYNQKSDIWSLGCILYEMICLKPPFFSDDLEDLYKKVNRGIYSKIPSTYSSDLATLIRMLLQTNPDQRPSCQKILQLKIVKKHTLQSQKDNNQNDQNLQKTTQEGHEKLLRTIKPSQNMSNLNGQLPKAKYQSSSIEKKAPKTLIEHDRSVFQQHFKQHRSKARKSLKQITQLEQLPILQNDRKMTPLQNTERISIHPKNSHPILPGRCRKKSQIQVTQKNMGKKNLQSQRTIIRQQILELRLPKVNNRNRKNSQKAVGGIGLTNHSKSLRAYKIFN